MLVTHYRTRFVPPPNPAATHLRCYARFEEDISAVLPYLNTRLQGHGFIKEPLSLTLKYRGKLITLTAHEIAINMVTDEAEAEAILTWLTQEINETWRKRQEIVPTYEVAIKPRLLEILKLLPRTNCRACGQPTCLVFAFRVSEGVQSVDDCPPLEPSNLNILRAYLYQFKNASMS